MRKTAMGVAAALALSLAVTGTALGADEQSGTTRITTTVDSSYILTIPNDTVIPYGATDTKLGGDLMVSGKIGANKKVTVSVDSVNRTLKPANNGATTIAYLLHKQGVDTAFVSEEWTASEAEASKEINLMVKIEQAAWEAANPGEYSDTITFRAALS